MLKSICDLLEFRLLRWLDVEIKNRFLTSEAIELLEIFIAKYLNCLMR